MLGMGYSGKDSDKKKKQKTKKNNWLQSQCPCSCYPFLRDAITKMKDVYLKNPQMGDPASLDQKLTEVTQNIEKLRLEAQKFEVWRTGRSWKGKGVSGQAPRGTPIPTSYLFSGRWYRRAGLCPRRGKPPA